MAIGKPHLELFPLNMDDGWEKPEGYPDGITQIVLVTDLDEDGKSGRRSRFLRFVPGEYTTAPFVHDHREEVFLVEGDLIVGNDENGFGDEKFTAPTFACRSPGACHVTGTTSSRRLTAH